MIHAILVSVTSIPLSSFISLVAFLIIPSPFSNCFNDLVDLIDSNAKSFENMCPMKRAIEITAATLPSLQGEDDESRKPLNHMESGADLLIPTGIHAVQGLLRQTAFASSSKEKISCNLSGMRTMPSS